MQNAQMVPLIPKPSAVTQVTTLMQWLWLLTKVPGCHWSRGTASFSQWQLHIKHHNKHQIISEDRGNSFPSPAHSWHSIVARAEQMKRTWVTLQLLDTIQRSGERSGRAVMLRGEDVLAPFSSPWPCPQHSSIWRGLEAVWLCTVCHVLPRFLFFAKHFSPSFPFLRFEMKVVAALSLKREAASFSRAAAICFFHRVMGRNGIYLSGHLRNHCSQTDSCKNTLGFWMAGYLRGLSFLSFLQFNLCASIPQFCSLQASPNQMPLSTHAS